LHSAGLVWARRPSVAAASRSLQQRTYELVIFFQKNKKKMVWPVLLKTNERYIELN
jgi:hypothetical protein